MRAWTNSNWHEVRGDFTHRTDLFAAEEAWTEVREALVEAGVPRSQLETRGCTVRFGLMRVSLDLPHGVDLRNLAAVGRNHLVGFGSVERRDDDVEGTPTIIGSALGRQTPADVAFLPREADGRGTGITVGVVDTGFRRHRWVRGACTYSPDDLEQDPGGDPERDRITGHGLFVAGLVLEQAPGATVRLERVLSTDGHAEAIDVHDAICRLACAGAQVINLSLGCFDDRDEAPFVLRHAVEWARAHQVDQGRERGDIVFIASAGNNGDRPDVDPAREFWPAALDDVWAVAAARPRPDVAGEWQISDYSSRSPDWVDVAAPGDDVLSCWTPFRGPAEAESGWGWWRGTSFATAVVSGLVAARLPELVPDERRKLCRPPDEGEVKAALERLGVGPVPYATAADDRLGRDGRWPVLGTATTARRGGPAHLTRRVPRPGLLEGLLHEGADLPGKLLHALQDVARGHD